MLKTNGIYYFDEEKGYERELKYCENQRTPFVDEMTGDQRLSHVIFRNGALFVERQKTVLQKLLTLHHPHNGSIFYEHKPETVAADEIEVGLTSPSVATTSLTLGVSSTATLPVLICLLSKA